VHLGDLAEELHAQACVELALQSFRSLDILVSNAGIFIANAATDDYRIEDFDRTVRNNIRTAFLMTKFALPHLRASRGNIVFTGSEAGLNGSAFADESLERLKDRIACIETINRLEPNGEHAPIKKLRERARLLERATPHLVVVETALDEDADAPSTFN